MHIKKYLNVIKTLNFSFFYEFFKNNLLLIARTKHLFRVNMNFY